MALDISDKGTAQLLNFAKELAVEGGKIIKEAFVKPVESDYGRKSKTDPVTVTDEAVEKYFFDRIKERYPDHIFIGEESASNVQWTDDPTWIIDPLDGTANFIHRIPNCAVSIGFTYKKDYIIGVIYNPMSNELFEASHLTASLLNGRPIHVSSVSELSSACISTEAGSDRSDNKINWIMTNFESILRNEVQCVRMMGSCALNMANIACGRVDLLYERGPYAWDMAAGVLIIRKAGGIVCAGSFHSQPTFDLTGRSLLAFTPSLKDELAVLAQNA